MCCIHVCICVSSTSLSLTTTHVQFVSDPKILFSCASAVLRCQWHQLFPVFLLLSCPSHCMVSEAMLAILSTLSISKWHQFFLRFQKCTSQSFYPVIKQPDASVWPTLAKSARRFFKVILKACHQFGSQHVRVGWVIKLKPCAGNE